MRKLVFLILAASLMTACGGGSTTMHAPVKNGAVLSAITSEAGHWEVVFAVPSESCEGEHKDIFQCVPPGTYQQQPADGDWCEWWYNPAGYDESQGSYARNYHDTDGDIVVLSAGDRLTYGPTKGAQRLGEGLRYSRGIWGDGYKRGCAEWIQVATSDGTAPTSSITAAECRDLADLGEKALGEVERTIESTDFTKFQTNRIVPGPEALQHQLSEFQEEMVPLLKVIDKTETVRYIAEECYLWLGDTSRRSILRNSNYDIRDLFGEVLTICVAAFPERYDRNCLRWKSL